MDLTQASLSGSRRKRRKRVGRGHGSGTGKTAGRGHKGAYSRSGAGYRPMFQGAALPFHRSFPKRGFSNFPFADRVRIVNVGSLERFADGDTVDVAKLAEARLVDDAPGVRVKILGDGKLTRRLTVKAHAFSKSAEKKIADAGGSVARI
jgi:large subunit ribosomal protein L15